MNFDAEIFKAETTRFYFRIVSILGSQQRVSGFKHLLYNCEGMGLDPSKHT